MRQEENELLTPEQWCEEFLQQSKNVGLDYFADAEERDRRRARQVERPRKVLRHLR